MSNQNYVLAATASNSYGYFGGGRHPGPPPIGVTYTCTIDRLDFSTETRTTPGSTLSEARGELAATSSSFYGYFAGGRASPSGSISTIDRLDFSTEIVSASSPSLPVGQLALAALSNSN